MTYISMYVPKPLGSTISKKFLSVIEFLTVNIGQVQFSFYNLRAILEKHVSKSTLIDFIKREYTA